MTAPFAAINLVKNLSVVCIVSVTFINKQVCQESANVANWVVFS